jgi:hypothetical protein
MKIISEKKTTKGARRMIVELLPDEALIAVREGAFYRLAYPVDDVVASHVVAEAVEVAWCSVSQAWVE